MNIKIPQLVHLLGTLFGAIGVPLMASDWIKQPSHLLIYSILVGLSTIFHTISPSIFGGPDQKSQKDTGITPSLILLPLLFLSTASWGQGTGLSASSGAVAINYKGVWSPATIINQSYDVLDFGKTKSNHLFVDGTQLLCPTPAINFYFGGLSVQPDFSFLTAKTNLPKFSFVFSGGMGVSQPTVGTSNIAWDAGGRLNYQMTPDLSWHTIEYHYFRDGSVGFDGISSGLQFIFGPKN